MHKYEILEEIDQGSYSTVFRVRSKATGDTFALKRMKEEFHEAKKLQMRELKILQQLNHPCVASLIDFFVADGFLVFVFEFLE
jgi:serine/threonine protein kinase